MDAEWLKSVGFTKFAPTASGDKRDEEWGIQGDSIALTVYPDGPHWYVRQDVSGEGILVPPPKDEGAALVLLSALSIPFPLTKRSVDTLRQAVGEIRFVAENRMAAELYAVDVGPYRVVNMLGPYCGSLGEFERVEDVLGGVPCRATAGHRVPGRRGPFPRW